MPASDPMSEDAFKFQVRDQLLYMIQEILRYPILK